MAEGRECEGQRYRPICDRIADGDERYRRLVLDADRKRDDPAYPSLAEQAGNALKAAGRVAVGLVATGHWRVSRERQEARMAICRACEHYDEAQVRCRVCGCFLEAKTAVATEECPLAPPKWSKEAPTGTAPTGTCGGCNQS